MTIEWKRALHTGLDWLGLKASKVHDLVGAPLDSPAELNRMRDSLIRDAVPDASKSLPPKGDWVTHDLREGLLREATNAVHQRFKHNVQATTLSPEQKNLLGFLGHWLFAPGQVAAPLREIQNVLKTPEDRFYENCEAIRISLSQSRQKGWQ